MAILVDDGTRLVVQGITGREGAFHTGRMLESGTNVVAGVTPGKGGQQHDGVPIFNTVREAAKEAGANASVIFVPPPFAADAIFESLDSGMSTVCCITEGIPVHDMMRVADYITTKDATIIGTTFIEILGKFEEDPETECAVMIGEIGGNAEQLAAEFVQGEMKTPVVAYIAGFTAPEGKTMGHAGAIVSGGESTAEAKSEALRRAGIRAATNPSEVAELVAEALEG